MSEEWRLPQVSACPNCGVGPLFLKEKVGARGSHGPDLLPHLGKWGLVGARFNVVVCGNCGLTRLVAGSDALERLRESEKWRRL